MTKTGILQPAKPRTRGTDLRHCHQPRLQTLGTRNRLDFHDVAVWAFHAALEDTFEANYRTGAAAKPSS
jgi:hypothetical protein